MLLSPVLDLLVPHRCTACRGRSEPPWCVACTRAAAARALDPDTTCPRCAGPAGRHACWRGRAPVDSVTAHYRYGGVVADAIVAGKVRGVRAVWGPLGHALAARVPPGRTSADVVTWVPAPAPRRRSRGYDHAELLARAVGDRLGRPVTALLEANPALPDRGQADAPDRPVLAAGAYRACAAARGSSVLLVDDVLTTGSTLQAAAIALQAGGPVEVHAAIVARAGAHELAGTR